MIIIMFCILFADAVEQYAPIGIAALKIPQEAYPTESFSVIDGNFQWSDRAFEV